MQYHYLIAGLEDIRLGQQMKLTYPDMLVLLREQLSADDWQLVELLQMKNDDPRIMDIWEQDAVRDRYEESSLSEEDYRTQLLYEYGMQSKCRFVRRWFEFNLNLNNVMAATICQKHGYEIDKAIVGDNEVAVLLRKGGVSKNSSLAASLPELKEIVALTEIDNLLERERAIDLLRWQWLDDETQFDYFEISNVLAYYLQATILHRWDDLTKDKGEQVFRDIIADMKRDVKF